MTPSTELFISDVDVANQTLGVLRQFDVDIQAALLERDGEGKADSDKMLNSSETYAERVAWLEGRKDAIATTNADYMDTVRELRDEAAAAQEAQRLAAKAQAEQITGQTGG
jgi:hypothetical protein